MFIWYKNIGKEWHNVMADWLAWSRPLWKRQWLGIRGTDYILLYRSSGSATCASKTRRNKRKWWIAICKTSIPRFYPTTQLLYIYVNLNIKFKQFNLNSIPEILITLAVIIGSHDKTTRLRTIGNSWSSHALSEFVNIPSASWEFGRR